MLLYLCFKTGRKIGRDKKWEDGVKGEGGGKGEECKQSCNFK